jgi:hypothetical protein
MPTRLKLFDLEGFAFSQAERRANGDNSHAAPHYAGILASFSETIREATVAGLKRWGAQSSLIGEVPSIKTLTQYPPESAAPTSTSPLRRDIEL